MRIFIVSSDNGSSNLGDEGMYEALVDRLRDTRADVRILATGRHTWVPRSFETEPLPSPERFCNARADRPLRHLGWKTLDFAADKLATRRAIARWLDRLTSADAEFGDDVEAAYAGALRRCDAVVFSGAGIICDPFTTGVYRWGAIARGARALGKPVFLSGQGIGPFKSARSLRFVAESLRDVEAVVLRERTFGKQLLVGAGVPPDKIFAAPDDATVIPLAPHRRIDELLADAGLDLSQPFVAANLGFFRHSSRPAELGFALPALAEFLERHDLQLLTVPNMFSGASADTRDCWQLTKHLRARGARAHYLSSPADASEAKGVLSRARFSLARRYHSAVFSLSAGTPCLGLYGSEYYRLKMLGLFDWYDLEDRCRDLGGLTKADLLDLLETALDTATEARRALELRNEELIPDCLPVCRWLFEADGPSG